MKTNSTLKNTTSATVGFETLCCTDTAPRQGNTALRMAKTLLLVMMLLLTVTLAKAAVYTSVATGNWNADATWSGSGIPGADDNVIITGGYTVTVNATGATCASLNVGGASAGTLRFSSSSTSTPVTLTVFGEVSVATNGTIGITNNSGGAFISALNIGGNLTVNGSLNLTTTNDDNASVVFNGNAQQTISGTGATCTFYSLTASNTSSAGLVLNRNIELRGYNVSGETNPTLNISANSVFDLATFTCNKTTVSGTTGTFTVNANATLKIGGTNAFPTGYTTNTINAASTVEYNGTAQNITNLTYGNLILGGSGTKTFGGSRTISGNLSIASGVIAGLGSSNSSANTLTLGGASTVNGSWGSTGSSADNTNDTYFTGTGILNVTTSTCNAVTASVTGHTNITCYAATDGTITVTASGGVAPYTFSKDNGAPYVTGDNATSHTFSGLSANEVYKIRVKDVSGCESPIVP